MYIGGNSWKMATEMVRTWVYLFFQVWFQVWRVELWCYTVGGNIVWS